MGERTRRTVGGAARGSGAEQVMDALVRVLVRDGLDGLSVRRVASEAGVSIGAVQHHFPTKDALLVAAAARITAYVRSRAEALIGRATTRQGPRTALTALCRLLANCAPASDERAEDTTASIVWLWYAAKATQPGPVADAFAAGWSRTEEHLRRLLAEEFPHVDATREAGHLLAVLDGVAVARAAEPGRMPRARGADLVRRHIDYLQRLDAMAAAGADRRELDAGSPVR